MKDITKLMNAYRECARNLWNVYYAGRQDFGASLDAFEEIRTLLFDSLVVDELCCEEEANAPSPVLKVVPRSRSLILIRRPTDDGNCYWDQEKDMVVGPDDIELEFLDYFDFAQLPVMDFRFYRCKILNFPSRPGYEGREALRPVLDGRVFHAKAPGTR